MMIVMPLLMTRLQAVTVSWDSAGIIVTLFVMLISIKFYERFLTI